MYSVCAGIADILFVLDSTGTIVPDDWDQILLFVVKVVENLYIAPNGVHVSIMTFNILPTLIFGFSKYTNRYDMINAIWDIKYVEGAGKLPLLTILIYDLCF